jgi:precorrin-6x reductase
VSTITVVRPGTQERHDRHLTIRDWEVIVSGAATLEEIAAALGAEQGDAVALCDGKVAVRSLPYETLAVPSAGLRVHNNTFGGPGRMGLDMTVPADG